MAAQAAGGDAAAPQPGVPEGQAKPCPPNRWAQSHDTLTDLACHHLAALRGPVPVTESGQVDEEKTNKFANPLAEQFPRLRFHTPQELVQGHVVQNDSLDREMLSGGSGVKAFQRAGATRNIWWNPQHVTAGIVTCGGLCPGLNSIIREVTRCLWHAYGVRKILGFRSGYNGFDSVEYEPVWLTNHDVRDIHMQGGSILMTGRGGFYPDLICDALTAHKVDQLFVVGGDGTQWAADVLYQVLRERHLAVSIVGIPKSIDNDVLYFDRTFGFDSAVAAASEVIRNAWTEAVSCKNGVSIVKLMGRDAGFVVSNTGTASTIVDLCLVPEVQWTMPDLLEHVDDTLRRQGQMVIVVAEGAGQDIIGPTGKKDSSGHTVYNDVGPYLKEHINKHLSRPGGMGGRCFYIDPSYIIRSVPATPNDHIYCTRMAYDAVHAAMRGYTGVCVGSVHNFMVMVPMNMIASGIRTVKLESSIWQVCVAGSKMPASLAGFGGKSRAFGDGHRKTKLRGHPEMFRNMSRL
eukprot:TRINITY_DN150_c0_g1_i1.p1 TRINITY_DN150_c0_g1~~TRINITY_DN150_c0_g1_i1.p1  ORF type:complete len:540 (+),score=143.82 TRINITY_DN150_c0_g1_i1:70-1620(+)